MKARTRLLLLLCILPLTAPAAQLYRWVDDSGKTHYSDQPPPPKTKRVQRLGAQGNVVETDKESYAMRQARQNSPVVLYATAECGLPCNQARDFLTQRHIPFQTKDPSTVPEDAIELKKLIGALEVPVVKVGASHHKGFEALAWDNLLQTAGYPLSYNPSATP